MYEIESKDIWNKQTKTADEYILVCFPLLKLEVSCLASPFRLLRCDKNDLFLLSHDLYDGGNRDKETIIHPTNIWPLNNMTDKNFQNDALVAVTENNLI